MYSINPQKHMENKYKKFVLAGLYGLIDGSAESLEYIMRYDFKARFKHEPDLIKVSSTNRFVDEQRLKGIWIGSMTATLIVKGEEYTLTRDWGEEYDNNKNHPNFDTDWFYESDDCFSWKKSQEILKSFNAEEQNNPTKST